MNWVWAWNLPMNQKLFKSLPFKFINEEIKIINDGYSFLFIGRCNIDMSNLALQLLIDGLENNETANYVCIDKHPITIWNNAKRLIPLLKIKTTILFLLMDIHRIMVLTMRY